MDRVLNFNSHHSRKAKLAAVRSLMNRLDSYFAPDDMEGKQLEYEHIVEVLRANDYPERFIHRVREEPHTHNGTYPTLPMKPVGMRGRFVHGYPYLM